MSTPQPERVPGALLPQTEAARLDWLRLIRSRRVGPATFVRLLSEYGDVTAALAALPQVAAAAGVNGYRVQSRDAAAEEWRRAEAAGAVPLFLGAPDYPPLLATTSDAPPFLWALGDVALLRRPGVALVGARNASALGGRMAARLAGDLGAHGFVVVSGLARGIDAVAHKTALETGTVAVQAGGVDTIYPAENAELAVAIAARGVRVSEMPMGHTPRAQDFPRRNRIISGMSHGIVVVEGAVKSGSLITARNALDQGREVMAVPGSPMDGRAGGCNQLIRDGATLVRGADDVIAALGIDPGAAATPPRPPAQDEIETAPRVPKDGPADEARLLALLGPVPVTEDTLTRELGESAARISAMLTGLELDGRIARHPGGMVGLAP